jgi:hypothetical protein
VSFLTPLADVVPRSEAFPAELMSARAYKLYVQLTVICHRSQASVGQRLTCHVKTTFTFLDGAITTRTRTQFRIARDPLLRFPKLGITMILSALVFIASHFLVPRDLMLETHLETAVFA